jgi:hypothetical protein
MVEYQVPRFPRDHSFSPTTIDGAQARMSARPSASDIQPQGRQANFVVIDISVAYHTDNARRSNRFLTNEMDGRRLAVACTRARLLNILIIDAEAARVAEGNDQRRYQRDHPSDDPRSKYYLREVLDAAQGGESGRVLRWTDHPSEEALVAQLAIVLKPD